MIEIEVKGLAEARRMLYQYGAEIGDKVVMMSLLDVARQVRRAMRAAAPVRTGRLRRAIVVRRSKIHSPRRRTGTLGVYITLRTGRGRQDPRDGFYGRFLERGWNVRGKRAGSRAEIVAAFGRRTGRRSLPGKRDIPGRYFMSGTFERMRAQIAHAFMTRVELAANRLAERIGLR